MSSETLSNPAPDVLLTPFTYSLRNEEVAQALEERGFIIVDQKPGDILVQAPDTISSTKARKIISLILKLYTSAKEVSHAQNKYNRFLEELNELD